MPAARRKQAWHGMQLVGNSYSTRSRFGFVLTCTDYLFCLPVPERAKPQHNFVAIPRPNVSSETLVWTAPEPNPKNPETANNTPQAMAQILDTQLVKYGCNVIFPSEEEFVSKLGGNTS